MKFGTVLSVYCTILPLLTKVSLTSVVTVTITVRIENKKDGGRPINYVVSQEPIGVFSKPFTVRFSIKGGRFMCFAVAFMLMETYTWCG